MTIEIVIAALALPLVLWLIWSKSDRVTYTGEAVAVPGTIFVGPTGKNAFITLAVGSKTILAEVPVDRVKELQAHAVVHVQIEQRQRLLQRERVERITWPFGEDEQKEHAGEKSFHGLVLSAYYLVLGLALMTTPFLWASAAALMLGGFICGNVTLGSAALAKAKLRPAQYLSFGFLAVMCLLCTYAVFGTMSIFTLFPGFAVAFGAGQLLGMLTPRLS